MDLKVPNWAQTMDGFKAGIEKEAQGGRLGKILAVGTAATGLGVGATGLVLHGKAQKERKKFMARTGRAVGVLAGEARSARHQRSQIAKALVINTQADVMSRRVLSRALTKNYKNDAARARAILKLHGLSPRKRR